MKVLRALFSFHGRLGRLQYFGYIALSSLVVVLAAPVFGILFGAVAAAIIGDVEAAPFGVLFPSMLPGIALFCWTGTALMSKRLHDLGLTAKHLFWMIPIFAASSSFGVADQAVQVSALEVVVMLVNLGIGLWLLFARGDQGPNRFGPDLLPAPAVATAA